MLVEWLGRSLRGLALLVILIVVAVSLWYSYGPHTPIDQWYSDRKSPPGFIMKFDAHGRFAGCQYTTPTKPNMFLANHDAMLIEGGMAVYGVSLGRGVLRWQETSYPYVSGQDIIVVPLWASAVVGILSLVGFPIASHLQRSARRRNGRCADCSYDLRAGNLRVQSADHALCRGRICARFLDYLVHP